MRGFVVLAVLSACGGGGGDGPADAADNNESAIAVDAPPMVTCNFTEAADATNVNTAGAEPTMLTFATGQGICGEVDNGHFANGAVDVDAYRFSVGADTDMLVHLTGNLGSLQRVVVQIARPTPQGSTLLNVGVFEGDHATNSVRLAAGEYIVAVVALNAMDIGAPIPYTLRLVSDAPDTRCPKSTAAESFLEANDGGAHDANDMIRYSQAANPQTSFTASTTDMPEPTNVTVAAGATHRIAGISALVNPNDDYNDRDTFAFTTGATTNQLTVRLNWTSTTIDFDFRVFPQASTLSVTGGLKAANTEDELQTFAVKPNTTYWLWVGAFDGSTGQPTRYDATLCGATFTP